MNNSIDYDHYSYNIDADVDEDDSIGSYPDLTV
ncbi:unnamed protein product [Schistosoma curassoni]|uniref:CPXV213 protein n=1 Tax=Schistosoma curassoni TaxID=6186 RepID=A0A183K6Z1_9TREM|nr:unnamed protein product [Schistosoma curassoni]